MATQDTVFYYIRRRIVDLVAEKHAFIQIGALKNRWPPQPARRGVLLPICDLLTPLMSLLTAVSASLTRCEGNAGPQLLLPQLLLLLQARLGAGVALEPLRAADRRKFIKACLDVAQPPAVSCALVPGDCANCGPWCGPWCVAERGSFAVIQSRAAT